MLKIDNIPAVGFGTDLIPEGETIYNSVKWAIEAGYRHIDNADCYKNEIGLGRAVRDCISSGIVSREDLFITNKVPDWKQGYEETIRCCEDSLRHTGLDYFDLYYIHSPLRPLEELSPYEATNKILQSYFALENLYERGLIKNIGVSNFEVRHLQAILPIVKIKPIVNQIELHPQHQQKEVVNFCKENNIQLVAWGTLNQGRIFKNDVFLKLSAKYAKSPAQIAVRWSLQRGYISLARSTKKEHIVSNFDVLDFTLSDDDMNLLDSLDGGEFSNMHYDRKKKRDYKPVHYIEWYKLFGFIPFLKKTKSQWYKIKWSLFGIIPLFKICKKEINGD